MIILSCKGSKYLAYLEKTISEIDPRETTRNGITNQAIKKSANLTKEEWLNTARELKKLKNELSGEEISFATAIQIKIDDEIEGDYGDTVDKIIEVLEIKAPQTRFLIEILCFSYMKYLKEEGAMIVGEPAEEGKDDISAPDIVKLLVKLLMLNQTKDKPIIEEIKEILLKWEDNSEMGKISTNLKHPINTWTYENVENWRKQSIIGMPPISHTFSTKEYQDAHAKLLELYPDSDFVTRPFTEEILLHSEIF